MSFVPAKLVLKNGATFRGISPSHQTGVAYGETVFATGMTGYVESLTDPSYAGQLLTFTYPLIGNYGVPPKKMWESGRVQPSGVIVSEACLAYSHRTAVESLLNWLKEQNVPVIIGVDTRQVAKTIRADGTLLGAIAAQKIPVKNFIDPNKTDLVAGVTIKRKKMYGCGTKKIIAVDCGMKENIIRCFTSFPLTIERVPYDYDYTNEPYDGLFLSNGPGDPAVCTTTIAILKKALEKKKPIFGICLGSQILALASGAQTYKLPFGHRGQNQPCQDTVSGKCVITSQNHGYAVKEKSLPKDWFVRYRNLNDGTVEGIAHSSLPFFSVQFHPEASPGPTDTMYLFEEFYKLL